LEKGAIQLEGLYL
jgi:hypothetical protein